MTWKALVLSIIVFVAASPAVADAHQPVLVMDDNPTRESPITVEEPEVSKAYYGEMGGSSEYYTVVSDRDFSLYLNLLVPDYSPFNARVFSADVRDSDGNLITMLDGSNSTWSRFHEVFGNADYLAGPEKRMNLTAGSYEVRVFNHDNEGRYSLAVGELERFSPTDVLEAAVLVPQINQRFFGMSPAESVLNASGALFLVSALAAAGAALLARRILPKVIKGGRKTRKKRRILS